MVYCEGPEAATFLMTSMLPLEAASGQPCFQDEWFENPYVHRYKHNYGYRRVLKHTQPRRDPDT